MFVGGSMKDILRTILSKDFLHMFLIADAGDDGLHMQVRMGLGHEEAHVMHGRFCLIDQDEMRGSEQGHLPCYLGAYAASSSCDEDALVSEHLANCLHVYLYLFARQQVLNLHLTQELMSEFALSVPLLSLRNHHYLDACCQKTVDERTAVGEVKGLYGGDEEDGHLLLYHVLNQVLIVIIDGDAQQASTLEGGVFGNEARYAISLVYGIENTLGKGYSTRLASIYEHPFGMDNITEGIMKGLDEDTQGPHRAGGQDEDEDGSLEPWEIEVGDEGVMHLHLMQQTYDGTRGGHRVGQAVEVHKRTVTKNSPIGVEGDERDEEDQQADYQANRDMREMVNEHLKSKLQIINCQAGYKYYETVHHEDTPVWQCSAR